MSTFLQKFSEKIKGFMSGSERVVISGRARELLDARADARWAALPGGFLPEVLPSVGHTLGPGLPCKSVLWQSGRATDRAFESHAVRSPLMDKPLCQTLMTGTCERVLR